MTDELQKYRDILLRKQAEEASFRSETVTVSVGGDELEIEVKALPIDQFSEAYVPDDLVDGLGAEMALKVTLVTKCSYIPGTETPIFNPPTSEDNPGDVWKIAEWPMSGRGPVERIFEVINYVHDFTVDPPEGVQDPRLEEMKEAADELAQIAQVAKNDEDEELSAAEVEEVAESIADRVRWIDHGSVTGK